MSFILANMGLPPPASPCEAWRAGFPKIIPWIYDLLHGKISIKGDKVKNNNFPHV